MSAIERTINLLLEQALQDHASGLHAGISQNAPGMVALSGGIKMLRVLQAVCELPEAPVAPPLPTITQKSLKEWVDKQQAKINHWEEEIDEDYGGDYETEEYVLDAQRTLLSRLCYDLLPDWKDD
jgi:hypothetical protein